MADPELKEKLREWQDYYNSERPHGSLGNQTPDERRFDLAVQVPLWEEVIAQYDEQKERIRIQSYRNDQQVEEVTDKNKGGRTKQKKAKD